MAKPSISVIGTGALGSVLAKALHENGFEIKSLYNRSKSSAAVLGKELNVELIGSFPQSKKELGEVIFLTVPDRTIADCANRLSSISTDFLDYIVAHCSGNYTSDLLAGLRDKKAFTASFHPLQTFTQNAETHDFKGIYIDVEGDEYAVNLLSDIADQLGSETLRIEPTAKPYLHAAAVMASNYMVALMEAASQTAEKGGISKKEALQALLPLAEKSMANISKGASLTEALSGPIARGDVSTVKSQLAALKGNSDLHQLYKQLGTVLLNMKKESGTNDENELEKLATILQ